MTSRHVPVLIVGAGFAGLTAALLLAVRGIACLVVERRATLSSHPRAHGVNLRSLELLRRVPGLEQDLHAVTRARPGDNTLLIAETVTGAPIKILAKPGGFNLQNISPATMCSAGQDRVEPVLLDHARKLGADIRFSTELVSLTQDKTGVNAMVRDPASGGCEPIRADYVIAADGSRSPVRRMLKVGMEGVQAISRAVSILFEADLHAVVPDCGFVLCYLRNPEFTGAFVSCDDINHGQLNIECDARLGIAQDLDYARCENLVGRALGCSDLAVRIVSVLPWTMDALLAERMRIGRVFLVGDAAHVMPPVGGLAGQAAIQDAADLAWKLALVLRGACGEDLLASYESERRPVAALSIARASDNYVSRLRQDRTDLSSPSGQTNYLDVAMGYRYRSRAISLDQPDDGLVTDDVLHPSGKPGSRLAHIVLGKDGRKISSHDLARDDFVLLAAPQGGAWMDAARKIIADGHVPLSALQVGVDVRDIDGGFLARTGLEDEGALLLRPDGFIAWRSKAGSSEPRAVLRKAIARAVGNEAVLDRVQPEENLNSGVL